MIREYMMGNIEKHGSNLDVAIQIMHCKAAVKRLDICRDWYGKGAQDMLLAEATRGNCHHVVGFLGLLQSGRVHPRGTIAVG